MKALDTNVLVYAHREDSPFHQQALAAMLDMANGSARWAVPWPCVHEFAGIVTHPRIFSPHSPLDTALEAIRRRMESPGCEMIGEGPGYFDLLRETASTAQVTGPMIHDARIATICLHNGVSELVTCDRDFSRFARLKTVNLLSLRK